MKMSKKSKNSDVTVQENLHFYFIGEDFTRMVRDFWNSNLVKTAIGCCTDSGVPVDVALKICTGEYKCVGDTREGDHTLEITEDDNPEEIYFTLESQIKNIEKKFINASQKLFKLVRKHEMLSGVEAGDGTLKVPGESSIFGAIYRKNDSKNNREIIEKLKKEQKTALENLEILYPLAGKKMSDLPVTDLGTDWSDIELDHYEIYEVSQQRNTRLEQNEKIKAEKILKKMLDADSYDQGEDETDEHYEKRMTVLAKKMNPIVDVKTTKTRNAWISPDGKIYDVELQPFPMHVNAASDYKYLEIVPNDIHNESDWLDKNGWMKLTSEEFYMDGKLTQSQTDMLLDYMTSRNLKTINWFGHPYNLKKIIEENESLARIRSKR